MKTLTEIKDSNNVKKQCPDKSLFNTLNDSNNTLNVKLYLNNFLHDLNQQLNIKGTPEKEVFNGLVNFLNTFLLDINMKKFYNTAPTLSLKDYNKLDISEQLINNVYDKKGLNLYKPIMTGGSCHNWVVFLYNLFKEISKIGLDIKTKILVYDNIGGHSFILIRFGNSNYLCDIGGFNELLKKIILPVDELALKLHNKEFNVFNSRNRNKNYKNISTFEDVDNFSDYIDLKKTNVITVSCKLGSGKVSQQIDFMVSKNIIKLSIDGADYILSCPKNKKLNIVSNNSTSFLYNLVSKYLGSKQDKEKIFYYMDFISPKISYYKLSSLFKS